MGAVGMESDACARDAHTHNSTDSQDGGSREDDVAARLLTKHAEDQRRSVQAGEGGLRQASADTGADGDGGEAYNSWLFWRQPPPPVASTTPAPAVRQHEASEQLVKRWWLESRAVAKGQQDVHLSGSTVVIDPRAAPLSTSEGGLASILHNLRPFTSLLRSFRRIYQSAEDGRTMGNLQGSDGKSKGGGKSPGKFRKNKDGNRKSPAKRTTAAPPQQQQQSQQEQVGTAGGCVGEARRGDNGAAVRPPAYLVTDSWRHANKQQLTPTSRESSSESVFTDPLTPHSGHLSEPGDMVSARTAVAACTTPDDVTLTLVEEPSTEESETSAVLVEPQVERRPQSYSLDALDEETLPTMTDEAPVEEDGRCKSRSADALEAADVLAPRAPPPGFTVVRHRKVELNPTRLSEHCLTSVAVCLGISTATQQHQEKHQEKDTRRHSSVSDAPLDSNVLRKVASLTLDKATLEQKVVRPRFVPEKLDFQIYEKFEGQMLINWFVSSFADDHYLRLILTSQDLRILAVQFCTHLLVAGVLRQIPDKDVPLEIMFRPDLMYYWAHTETPTAVPPTPGRLSQLSWPPTSPGLPDVTSIIPTSTATNCRPGAKYTEAEFQQVVMGMKREHKENLNRLSQSQEVNLFNFRGEVAQKLSEKDERILQLELEIKMLTQELDKYKTLADIQSLTAHAAADFGSPTAEQKRFLHEAKKPLGSQTPKEGVQDVCAARSAGAAHKPTMIDAATDTSDLPAVQLADVATSPEPLQAKLSTFTQTPQVTASFVQSNGRSSARSLEMQLANGEQELTSVTPKKTAETIHFNQVNIEKTPASSEQEENLPPPVSGPATEHSYPLPEANSLALPITSQPPSQSYAQSPSPPPVLDKTSLSPHSLATDPQPMPEMGPTPLEPMPGVGSTPEPPMVEKSPPSSSTSGMGPPPPPMPSMGPPSAPMPSMGPPPAPMPIMGPPPPLMPGMGPPPPPPMPGMGPPPPPMPGMGPPPPPMPGMGPPPPPMPGMGPPPPPMPGMGPPPPPMAGMGLPPPPPPQPGTGVSGPAVPGIGPMPFPAPPVGGWAANKAMLRKKPVTPPVPMKPLYWTRIVVPATEEPAVDITDTPAPAIEKFPLWEKLEEAPIEDMKEFEELFSRQVVERKQTKKKEEKPTKQQAVKILDSKRSQSVGILSSSLHVEFSEIENAIYNFDTSAVNLEALQQIYEVRATEEELAAVRNHVRTNPDIPLDKPEQFLYELAEIPMFAFRISCFMFQSQFDDSISSIESKLNNLKLTCEFLTSSESLKVVFAIILALGNYMNGGNRTRGQADGFGLEILAKLKDVRSKDSSVTLLHFIVRSYIKKTGDSSSLDPSLALPIPEPGDVDRAGSVNFEDLKSDLDKLKTELTTCEMKTEKVIGASNEDNAQPFKQKMEMFLKRANEQLAGEFSHLQECKQKFMTTMEFYQYQPKGGVNPDELDPKEFFALWSPFCTDFKDIWKKEQQRIIKEKAQQVKRLQEQRRDVKKSKLDEKGLKAKLQRKFR